MKKASDVCKVVLPGSKSTVPYALSLTTLCSLHVVEYRIEISTNLYKARPMWDGRDIREEKMFQQAQITKELADEID